MSEKTENQPLGGEGSDASAGSVLTLRFNDGTERDYTEEGFNKLKSTGMLWEFHHDAPMKFTPNNQRCHGKANK